MLFIKKSKFKPKFKQLIKLRENVLNQKKILKLKKAKWENFILYYTRKLKRYKKYKPHDQNRYSVSKYLSRRTSYKKKFLETLRASQVLRLFYGNITKGYLKKKIKFTLKNLNSFNKTIHVNDLFLESFENQLSTVIHRAKFSKSLREAQQFILHGKILINNKVVKSKIYTLKQGDIISVNLNDIELIKKNIQSISKQYLPPKHLLINYKTFQIVFGSIKHTNLSTAFNFNLNLEKILVNYNR
jgi:ribosomal protein S4